MKDSVKNKAIKKALLFIPPATTMAKRIDIAALPPLGLGYIAAVLEEKGIEVKIVDSLIEGSHSSTKVDRETIRVGLTFEKIENAIRKFAPDLVGVNNLFSMQSENAHKIYEISKQLDSGIVTVAGGAHPTATPELTLADNNVDYVILGEGEESIAALIDSLAGKRTLSNIDGIGFRENGEISISPKTRFIEDLDSIPFPARHLMKMEKYFNVKASHGGRLHKRFSPIVTSRGCPAKCTFCTAHKVWGRKFRSRSPKNIISEMKHLRDRYRIREIAFEDDNVTFNPKRAEAIFEMMIKEKLNLKWNTPNGVAAWTLSENLISKMKESGCYRLNIALESGNQDVLKNIIQKPLNLKKVKPLVKYARGIGLDIGIFLVIGMPGETIEQMWDSFHLAEELGVYFPHISIATPYPGSKLYDICIENDYVRKNFSFRDLYIRGYTISTKDWGNKELKETLAEGQRYLLKSAFRKNPVYFAKRAARRFYTMPGDTVKRATRFLIQKKWDEIRG